MLLGAAQANKEEIGTWLARLVPVETFVPHKYRRWRPLVRDAMFYVFSHLSEKRLVPKIIEQIELPTDMAPELRLMRLIAKMPGLQKMGQVLARNRQLAPQVRKALSELENGISDVTPSDISAAIIEQLGTRLKTHQVEVEPAIFSEASVSAVVRFTWWNPQRAQRERGVFKVLKSHIPDCFAEDMTLLQGVGNFLSSKDRGYGFAVRDIAEILSEVRTLLEHELDFEREQASLIDAVRAYRYTFGVRVPHLIKPLSTAHITAMTEESGVKVTDAFRNFPIRRSRIAEQLVEGLLAVPLFSREEDVVFHADPHAGNLLYDEARRELIILDWALAQKLRLSLRRHLAMLVLMMNLRNREGVSEAIKGLVERGARSPDRLRQIEKSVARFFRNLGDAPGTLDAMELLDQLALKGVRFPAPLALFRKVIFTLEGVMFDVAGYDVRMDYFMARDYLTRWIASFGMFMAPLSLRDWIAVEGSAIKFGAAIVKRSLLGGLIP